MAVSVQVLPAHPDSVLNPRYVMGSRFSPKFLRAMQMPPNARARLLQYSNQAVRSGTVSWEPVLDRLGADAWPALEAILMVCGCAARAPLFWDTFRNRLNNVLLGIGDGINDTFQLRRTFTVAGVTVYEDITHPIHGWAAPLDVATAADGNSMLQNTLGVTVGGLAQPGGNFVLTNTTGRIVFGGAHIPPPGAEVRASCYHVYPVVLLDEQPEIECRYGLHHVRDLRIAQLPG